MTSPLSAHCSMHVGFMAFDVVRGFKEGSDDGIVGFSNPDLVLVIS